MVTVGRLINIKDHPTDPNLCVVQNNSMQVVAGRHYEEGQLAFFITEGTTVPQKLLEEMWLWNHDLNKGRLGGKRGDRVKAREMSGVKSEGLFYGATYHHNGELVNSPSWNPDWVEGQDVSEILGINV